MNRSLFLLFLLQCSLWFPAHQHLYAQYEQVWVFGQKAGLDFSNGDPHAIGSSLEGSFGESSASVCDRNGRLLFYTEGTKVWDKSGNVMQGGANLLPIASNNQYTSTSSACQGSIIVPQPGNEHLFYVFSLTSLEQKENAGRLYYSLIDMRLNNGFGDVVSNEKGILLDSGLKEQMTSVVGERCNVWLMVRSTENVFKAFSVSSWGLDSVPKLSEAGELSKGLIFTGQMIVSPDRRKLVTVNVYAAMPVSGSVDLFHFDAATGKVSFDRTLDKNFGSYGAAFSPDNTKLYVTGSAIGEIFQFNLTATNPAESKVFIGKIFPLSQLKLGPNGKIYGRSNSSDLKLLSIDFPNLAGTSCRLVTEAIQLQDGSEMQMGLPNVISYVTKTDAPSVVTYKESPCWFSAEQGYMLQAKGDGWDYIWDDGSIGASRKVNGPGRYWVTYYSAPCRRHVDSFVFRTPYGVLPAIGIEPSCRNSSKGSAWAYSDPQDTVRYQYVWRNQQNHILANNDTLSGVPAGTYSLQVTTAYCDTTIWLTIPELTERVSFSVDSLLCVGDTVWLENGSGSYYQDFYWQVDTHLLSTARAPYFVAEQPGEFTIELIGQGSICRDTASSVIAVDAKVKTGFKLSLDSICTGQAVALEYQNKNHTLIAQTWFIDEAYVQVPLTDKVWQRAFDRDGLQPITLHSEYRACPSYDFSDTIFVQALPKIDLGTDRELCLNGNTLLLGNRHALSPAHYLWNTGDTSSTLAIRHPGYYTLTAYTPGLGCSSTEGVEVRKNCYMDIPNAFTPNGDGHNDFFFPRVKLSEGIVGFHLQVFNRFGQIVFETKGLEGRGWDGLFNGQEQPLGVYVYKIDVRLNQVTETYTGNVTLFR